jgi:heme-degrading monooxygenase HmoA
VTTDSQQVLRIFRAEVKLGHEAEWRQVLADGFPRYLAGTPGLLGWYSGMTVDPDSHEYVVVTIWRDKDALRAFSGASFGPVLFPTQHDLADSIVVDQYDIEITDDGIHGRLSSS